MRMCHCPLDLLPSPTTRMGRDERVHLTVPPDARPAADGGLAATSPHNPESNDPDGSMTRAPTALSAGYARVSSRRPVGPVDRMPLGWAIPPPPWACA